MKRAALLLSLILLAGCTPAAEVPAPTPSPAATPAPTPELTPAPQTAPPAAEPYALVLDGSEYAVGGAFLPTEILAAAEMTEFQPEFPFPAGRQYQGKTVSAQTFLQEDGEKLVSITTWGPGQTPEGISIGSTLEELRAAYGAELSFIDGACGNGMEPAAYTRRYDYFRPDDGTNRAYSFYLNEQKVVTIEVYDGLDAPRDWFVHEAVLGDPRIRWEVLSDKPGSALTRYFIYDESGAEETVLEVHGGTEAHDLDGDGVKEIVAWLPGNLSAVGIYDSVDNALLYTDVNQILGSQWSNLMGLATGLSHPYAMCIEVGSEPGKSGDVYSYADGKLTYECSYEEAMGWT